MVTAHIADVQEVIRRIDSIAEAVIGSVADQGGATESISRNATTAADGTGEVSRRITAVSEDAGETRKLAETIDHHAAGVSSQVGHLKDRLTGLLERLARCGRMMDAPSETLRHFGEYGIFR